MIELAMKMAVTAAIPTCTHSLNYLLTDVSENCRHLKHIIVMDMKEVSWHIAAYPVLLLINLRGCRVKV